MNVLDNCVCEPAANIGEVFPFLKVLATDAPITFVTTVDRFLFPHPFFIFPERFPRQMLIASPFLPSINSRSGHLLLKLPITSTRTFYSQWKGSGVTSYQRVKESENIAPLWRKPLEKNQTVRIRKIKSCFILVSRSGFSVPVLVGPNMCERHKLNTELQQQQLSQLTPFHLHLINSFTKFTPRNKNTHVWTVGFGRRPDLSL